MHNALQEEETNVQVFRFDGNDLACIYSGLEMGEDSSIAAYLADNYKAVVEYKPLGLKKSKSLLDLGYTKNNYRIRMIRVKRTNILIVMFIRMEN